MDSWSGHCGTGIGLEMAIPIGCSFAGRGYVTCDRGPREADPAVGVIAGWRGTEGLAIGGGSLSILPSADRVGG